MRPMSIRAPSSAGSAGAGEPPSCAADDSEGGEAGLEVVGEVTGPSTDASPLPPPVAVSAAAAAACSEPSAAAAAARFFCGEDKSPPSRLRLVFASALSFLRF